MMRFLPYYFLFLCLAVLSAAFDFRRIGQRTKDVAYYFLLLVLTLFAGTRVGWKDQAEYTWIFDMIAPFPGFLLGNAYVDFGVEYLYLLLNSFLKYFSENPGILFLTVAFGTVSAHLYVYKKYSAYFIFTAIMFYSNSFFSGPMIAMRTGIVAALTLVGMACLIEKRTAIFFLIIVFAFFFHTSAVFVLFGYVLCRLNCSTRTMLGIVVASLILGMITPAAHWLFGLFEQFSGSNSIFDKGLAYLDDETFGYAAGVFRPTMVKQLAILLVAMRYRQYLAQRLSYFDVVFNFYCASTIWRYMFNDVALIASRVGGVLSIGEPLLLTSFLFLFKAQQRVWIAALLVLLAVGSFHLNSIMFDFPPYVSTLFGGTY